jgi:hypothetical protein
VDSEEKAAHQNENDKELTDGKRGRERGERRGFWWGKR